MPELQLKHPDLYERITTQARLIPNHEAVLWKITWPGRPASYLLGTVHTSDPRIARLSPSVERALLKARTVATEIAIQSRIRMYEHLKKDPARLFYSDGTTLQSRLTTEEFDRALIAMSKVGFPARVAGAFRPWFAHFLLAWPPCERRRASKGYSVLDQIIGDEARNNRIPVIGLETIGEQIDAFASMSERAHLTFLRQILKAYGIRDGEDEFETLLQLYLTRRMDLALPIQTEMAKAEGLDLAPFEEFNSAILFKRNNVMRDRSLPLLEKGGAFIAVGALHLVGKDGLVALFRKAGYTVTAIE